MRSPLPSSRSRIADSREQYLKGTASYHRGRHEFKAGFEGDFTHLRENFSDIITDPVAIRSRHSPDISILWARIRSGTIGIRAGPDPARPMDDQRGPSLGPLPASGQSECAQSARCRVARYFSSANVVLHASYDRAFQTPAFENILLASSPTVVSLNPERSPVAR